MSAACAAIVVDIANDTTGKYGPVQGTWAGQGYGLRQRGEARLWPRVPAP